MGGSTVRLSPHTIDELKKLANGVGKIEESYGVKDEAATDRKLIGLIKVGLENKIITDETGTIFYASRSVCKLLGYNQQELVGKQITTLIPERMRPLHSSKFLEAVKKAKDRKGKPPIEGEDHVHIDCNALTKQGQEIPLSVKAKIIEDDGAFFGTGTFTLLDQKPAKDPSP